MKIVLFHPVSLPSTHYGGVERVVLWLAKGLAERGHEVFVAAREGSRLPLYAKLLSVPAGAKTKDILFKPSFLPSGVDCIHFMAPERDLDLKKLGMKTLFTIHGNGAPGEIFSKGCVFLSRNHALRHGSETFVYNGLDPKDYVFNGSPKRSSFLFLSKTSWKVKNVAGALSLCVEAKQPLKIAGGDRPYHLRAKAFWYRRFRGQEIQWIGAVENTSKSKLLAEARALLFPVRWPEPFGLVVAEALFSGTPVFASPEGSLPELIDPRVGLLLKTKESWLEALTDRNLQFDPEACRARAMEHFHYLKMAEAYEKLYKQSNL